MCHIRADVAENGTLKLVNNTLFGMRLQMNFSLQNEREYTGVLENNALRGSILSNPKLF